MNSSILIFCLQTSQHVINFFQLCFSLLISMPKKKSKEKENIEKPHEGRPAALTLGDFLFPPNVPSSSTVASPIKTVSPEVPSSIKKTPAQDVFICRTKKGGLPVKVENRSSGKKVTVIEHVVGNSKLILQEMKNKFGTGGINQGDFIELQGDCKTKVTKYLNDNKYLLKPYGTIK